MTQELALLLVLILFSAFFSASELAYLISNRLKIELRTNRKSFASESARYFISNSDEFFSTVLIGNNIVNIAFASISAIVLFSLFNFNEWQILIISSVILLIFGELIPKYLAGDIPHTIFLLVAAPLKMVFIVLSPLVKFTSRISAAVTGSTDKKKQNVLEREDLILLVRESLDQPSGDDQQSKIIQRIFDLKETRVYEVMRPRTEIVGIELNSSLDLVLKKFAESGYSKLPVFDESLDNIKGVIYAFDLFKNPEKLEDIIREVPYVPETKKCIELLNELMSSRLSLAIVVDEFGGTAGIITLEDVLEEMFGEIKDEYDTEDIVLKRVKPDTYLMSGKVELDHIVEKFQLLIPSGDYTTLSGFITAQSGKIPEQGEVVHIGNFQFSIIKANKVRVEFVRLRILDE